MQSLYLRKIFSHIAANKIKFLVLTFCFLTGCMSGYYSPDHISHRLGTAIKYNLEERYLSSGGDVTVVVLSLMFAFAAWIFGFTPAGIVLLPLMLLINAGLQVFLFRIIFLDIDFGGGLLAALSVFLFILWAVCSIAMCELSMESAAHIFQYRKWGMSLMEKASFMNQKAILFSILSALYVVLSLFVFLANKAIF